MALSKLNLSTFSALIECLFCSINHEDVRVVRIVQYVHQSLENLAGGYLI